MSPEVRVELQRQWTDLFKDVEASLNKDPAGPRAQELAARWVTLLAAFTPGGNLDAELVKQFGAAYQASGESWPPMAGFRINVCGNSWARLWRFAETFPP
jgi:hypothetical protein